MKLITKIEDMLNMPITWLKQPAEPQWSAVVSGAICELIMNDFPDEPLYTLSWNGHTLDIDDAPAGWVIPHK